MIYSPAPTPDEYESPKAVHSNVSLPRRRLIVSILSAKGEAYTPERATKIAKEVMLAFKRLAMATVEMVTVYQGLT